MNPRAASGASGVPPPPPGFRFGDQGMALRNGTPTSDFTFRAQSDRPAPHFNREPIPHPQVSARKYGKRLPRATYTRGSRGRRPQQRASDRDLFNAPRETTPEQMDEMREGNARFKDLADISETDASMDLSSSTDGGDVDSGYVMTCRMETRC